MPASRRLRAIGPAAARHARRLSLRSRLLLGLVLVAAVGLVVADVVVYNEIGAYLNNQVDTQLQTGAQIALAELRNPHFSDLPKLPLNTAAEVVSTNGVPLFSVPSGFHLTIAKGSLVPLLNASSGATLQFTMTGSLNGTSGSYRVLAENVYVSSGFGSLPSLGVALLGVPLSGLEGTLGQLVLIEIAVSAAALLVLIGLGYAVVRVGLRPLERIEETAGQIADGDLSLRVDDDDPATEVGRLGAALNVMLAQIEHAFTEQRASEDRLRQFLADASHELRTPVTSIRGYSELFRRGAANRPEDLALAMRRIEDEAARMGVLVDDLLLLARLDQGRPLERAPVDLAAIAIDAAADAQVVAPDRTLSVEAPTPVVLEGDEQRLRQVVGNLVQNAIRHTPPGTAVEVSVRTEGERAVLAVHDDGPGVAPEHAPHVFKRFYRADPSRTRGSGGSGLGLAIVASIAEAHGGVARLDTGRGAGSTFVVELPLGSGIESPAEDRDAAIGPPDGHADGAEPPAIATDRAPSPPEVPVVTAAPDTER
ncbi:MAG TPA: HAMP domain-containing sensor histidine kinase [Acidimicrobiales bacterium]|nr:HAMP domain-containing sensor histidine kinase [Acidimicrobiales bacterium]